MNLTELFKNTFEPELLEEMENNSTLMTAKEGDVIIDIGNTIRLIPLILKGSVRISRKDEDGRELFLYYINSSESCALTFTCCMQLNASEVKAVAEEDVEFLAIPIGLMDEWMMKYSTWKSYVMKTIRIRFNELLKTIDQIAFQKLDERLIQYLKTKSQNAESTLVNLSHEQIATDLATSRVVISRLLKKLENDNKLLLYRNQIKLLKEL